MWKKRFQKVFASQGDEHQKIGAIFYNRAFFLAGTVCCIKEESLSLQEVRVFPVLAGNCEKFGNPAVFCNSAFHNVFQSLSYLFRTLPEDLQELLTFFLAQYPKAHFFIDEIPVSKNNVQFHGIRIEGKPQLLQYMELLARYETFSG